MINLESDRYNFVLGVAYSRRCAIIAPVRVRGPLLLAIVLLVGGCDAERGGFGPLPTTAGATSTVPAGGSPSPPTADAPVVIATPGYVYEPLSVTLTAGRETILELRNPDSRAHTLTVNELSLQMVARPGETVRLPISPARRGSFVMYCSSPGHRAAGHQGRFLVR